MNRNATMLVRLIIIGLLPTAFAAAEEPLEDNIQALFDARLFTDGHTVLEAVEPTMSNYGTAQRLLGDVYREGIGVAVDDGQALRHYRAASKAGDAHAGYQMGLAYETGKGVPQSSEAAFTQYDQAALDCPHAALRYAEMVLANSGKNELTVRHSPVERLRFAADNGIPKAQYWVGRMALEGEIEGIDENEAQLLLQSAAPDVAEASTILGIREHRAGRYSEARTSFNSALTGGDSAAAAYLGHYAEHGIEEPIDRQRALTMYAKATEVEWANEGRRRIEAHFSSVVIFGQRIYGMTRAEVRERFAELGIRRIGGEPYFDAFDASPRLGGRRGIVTVAYAPGAPEYVAEVNYKFESDDRRQMRDLYAEGNGTLEGRYGTAESSNRSRGTRSTNWRQGEVSIQLTHNSRELFLNVTYHLQPYALTLSKYVEGQRNDGGIKDAL